MKPKVIKGAAALLVVGLGVGVYIVRKTRSEGPIGFRIGTIDRGSVEQIVTATGQLNAVVTVQVGSQVSGIIQKLYADFNSAVKEGQVIAQIDPTRFRATLEQSLASMKNAQASAARARVNFEHARREYERAKALADRQVIGEAEFEDLKAKMELGQVEMASAEAQVSQARAASNAARVDLERSTIRAPISGTVLQRAVDVGQTVAASLSAPTLFTIAQDLSKMEVRAQIDEADVGKLREGLDAQFSVDAYPGRQFAASIFQIRSNPNVQQNVVTYDAILRVDNPDGKLRPGMTANVRIISEKRDDVLRVPNAALRFKPPAELIAEGKSESPVARSGDGGSATGERRRAGGGGGPRGGKGEARGKDGPRTIARVFKPMGEKVATVGFRAGISDDQYTEIVAGPLSLGDEVVIEVLGAGAAAGGDSRSSSSGSSRSRGGPPRLF